MSEGLLQDRVAIVTGGSRGIGHSIAARFVKEGSAAVLIARNPGDLSRAAYALGAPGARVATVAGDVADEETAMRAFELAGREFGPVDVLVNCAGTITREPLSELTTGAWQRVLDVNLTGAFHMCKAVIPSMAERGYGKIINVTSQMARVPHPAASASYEVSKAGLTALTRHLAFHYAPAGIRVNAIAPGSIDTDLPRSMSEEARARLKAAIPLRRLGEPEEVGHTAVFLASRLSDYITGATITVTGGSLMD